MYLSKLPFSTRNLTPRLESIAKRCHHRPASNPKTNRYHCFWRWKNERNRKQHHRLDFTACVAPLGNARPLRHPKPQLKAIAQPILAHWRLPNYNGSNSTSGGYLDNALISGSENNLRLLYRASSANDWTTLPSAQYTINTQGSSTDKKGSISLANLQFGE